MPKLYTSYFGKLSALRRAGIIPICIARGVPKFYVGPILKSVAPFGWMLSDSVSREKYIDAYFNQVLKSVDPQWLLNQCFILSGGNDAALLCYEKPTDFCHRHLLADWLNKELDIDVKEFDVIGEPWNHENMRVEQGSLFGNF